MSEEYGNNGYNGYHTTGSDMNNTTNNEHQGSGAYGRQTICLLYTSTPLLKRYRISMIT